MNASMVPFDAASKHSNPCMIWPLAKTSIRKRPPLVSSTIFAKYSAVSCTSRERAQAVDMRHWILGCAMTLGAWTMAAAVAAVNAPPAVEMNLRRSVITLSSSPRHELVVGTLGHVVPRPDERLELGERGVHLPGHRRLLGFLPGDLGREPLQIAQHGDRDLSHLDLALELRLE